MPELPEVESVRRQLEPALRGRRVVAVWADAQRRFHAPERMLGRTVQGVGGAASSCSARWTAAWSWCCTWA
jgi:formamidopyrimidine-DNA glycosylase